MRFLPILLADRMHMAYSQVLEQPLDVIGLYLELMAAEAEAERLVRQELEREARRRR